MKFKIGTWDTILILIDQNTGCEAAVIKAVNMLICMLLLLCICLITALSSKQFDIVVIVI